MHDWGGFTEVGEGFMVWGEKKIPGGEHVQDWCLSESCCDELIRPSSFDPWISV